MPIFIKQSPSLSDEQACQLAHSAYTQGRFALALQYIQAVAKRRQDWFGAQNLYAVLLTHTGQPQEALPIFQKWSLLQAADLGLKMNLAWCHMQLQQYQPALRLYHQVLAEQPQNQTALEMGGLAASRLMRFEEALALWQALSPHRPADAQLIYNIGATYQELGDIQGANAHYLQALRLDPEHFLAASNAMFAEHYLGSMDALAVFQATKKLGLSLSQGSKPYASWQSACNPDRPRLRIAVISPDLHEHPVGYFFSGLLKHTAAEDVEWYAYSDFDERALSPWAKQLRQGFSIVRNTSHLSDPEVAALVHADAIDILIDLVGWGRGQRLAVFAHKPAPVQLTWLGYFASTGLTEMDGIIADPFSIPVHEEHLYTEQVWRMPTTRLSYNMHSEVANSPISGLPALAKGHFTFGCFQNLNKLNDLVIQTWAEIAKEVPTARWHIQSHQLDIPLSRERLQTRLSQAGFNLQQLDLLGKQSFSEYMQAYAQVDILLDTFPYPGGTTTLEALWMGVPTLTLTSAGMLGRQGQALLSATAVDPAWICETRNAYIDQAIHFAQPAQWQELAQWRSSLREQLPNTPAFNTRQFAHDWLKLIRSIWVDACAKRPWRSTLT